MSEPKRDPAESMDPDAAQAWVTRWEQGETQWHRDEVNPDLMAHVGPWRRVLVPLCGASLDVAWLAERGMEVVGVELSAIPCQRLFEQWGRTPRIEPADAPDDPYTRYISPPVTVLQGDVLALRPGHAGTFDGVWDRGALVALDPSLRADYLAALSRVAHGAELLLSTFHYAEGVMEGPPFSVDEAFIEASFDRVERLDERGAELASDVAAVSRLHRARIRPFR